MFRNAHQRSVLHSLTVPNNDVDCDAFFPDGYLNHGYKNRLFQMFFVTPTDITVDETGMSWLSSCAVDSSVCDGSPEGCGVHTYFDTTQVIDIEGAPFQQSLGAIPLRTAVMKDVASSAVEDQHWMFDRCAGQSNILNPYYMHLCVSVNGVTNDPFHSEESDSGCFFKGPAPFHGSCEDNPHSTFVGDTVRLRWCQDGREAHEDADHPLMRFDWVSPPTHVFNNPEHKSDKQLFSKFASFTNSNHAGGYDFSKQRGNLPLGDTLNNEGYIRLHPVTDTNSDMYDYNLCLTMGDADSAKPSPKFHCGHPGFSLTVDVCGKFPERQLIGFSTGYEELHEFPFPMKDFQLYDFA